MPGPKSRISRSRRGMRNSHSALNQQATRNCTNCNSVVRPHHACSFCGYYRGREVIALNK